jgi:NADH dehydrogenase (ubiquinone) 1 alpha subcomplex subunit 10
LKDIETHAHVLIYDWTNEGDISTIVEDIEMLNFDYGKNDKKMADWRFSTVQEVRLKRLMCEDRRILHNDYHRFNLSIPEMHYTAEDDKEIKTLMATVCTYDATKIYKLCIISVI